MKIKRLLLFLVAGTLFGQSATPINYPNFNFSGYATQEAQAVPTSPTVVTAGNIIFGGGWISCGTLGRTITITDGNSIAVMTAVQVSANQIVSLGLLSGSYVSKGFSISASGTGCTYHAWWRY